MLSLTKWEGFLFKMYQNTMSSASMRAHPDVNVAALSLAFFTA